jgi:AcrR family transcriptional regulator
MTSESDSAPDRPTQAEGRDRTRNAVLRAAAHEFSRFGYADSALERVVNEVWSSVDEASPPADLSAGAVYARPELYHLFRSKEELALAVVQWLEETWYEEVGYLFADESDPAGALLAVARGHAVFSRKVPPVVTTFKAEFEGRDHPVGRAVNQTLGRFIDDTVRLITTGRRSGAIPPGPPPKELALAYLGALDWVVKTLRGQAPFDALLAEKAVLGLLGLAPAAD